MVPPVSTPNLLDLVHELYAKGENPIELTLEQFIEYVEHVETTYPEASRMLQEDWERRFGPGMREYKYKGILVCPMSEEDERRAQRTD